MNNPFSYKMHDQTERPGQLLSQDALHVIRQRYDFAAKISRNLHVLEVGAGHGIASKLLSREAASYIAGEYSDENLALMLLRKSVSIPWVQFDAHQLPFKPRSFDAVITLAMIYYLDFDRFLDQVKKVLKPEGKLIFCTSNKAVPGFVAAPYTKRYYTVPELNQILKNKGFDCQFSGAFLAPGGSYFFRSLKAFIKNIVKTVISILPQGKAWWQKLRVGHMGTTLPLPWHVEEISAETQEMMPLSPDKINKDFRIIYSVATLKNLEGQGS